jgi:metal-responsive CopG/Arc/MetJ family transcriptional regulator
MAKKVRPADRPVVNTERVQMRFSKDFLQTVDEWRRLQADLPGRTEAIRRLVQLGIDAPAPRKR